MIGIHTSNITPKEKCYERWSHNVLMLAWHGAKHVVDKKLGRETRDDRSHLRALNLWRTGIETQVPPLPHVSKGASTMKWKRSLASISSYIQSMRWNDISLSNGSCRHVILQYHATSAPFYRPIVCLSCQFLLSWLASAPCCCCYGLLLLRSLLRCPGVHVSSIYVYPVDRGPKLS